MTDHSKLLGLGVFSALASLAISAVASAEEFQDVHECDQYAAHPSDPHRWAAGVEDNDIIPGPAVKFCREAVDDHPETPRFVFQLGRALWAANRIDEGTDVFTSPLKLRMKTLPSPPRKKFRSMMIPGATASQPAMTLYTEATARHYKPAASRPRFPCSFIDLAKYQLIFRCLDLYRKYNKS